MLINWGWNKIKGSKPHHPWGNHLLFVSLSKAAIQLLTYTFFPDCVCIWSSFKPKELCRGHIFVLQLTTILRSGSLNWFLLHGYTLMSLYHAFHTTIYEEVTTFIQSSWLCYDWLLQFLLHCLCMNTWAINIIQTAQHGFYGSLRPCIREKLSKHNILWLTELGTFTSLLATPSSSKYLAESHLRPTHTWIGNVYWQEKFQVLKLASLVLGETTSSVSSWWLICSNQTMFGKSIKPVLCCGNEQDIMFRPKKCHIWI